VKVIQTTGRGRAVIAALADRRFAPYERVLAPARRIVESVRRGGDTALLRLRSKFDKIPPQSPLRIPEIELQLAWESTPATLQQALETAARNIRAFATRQRPKDFDLKPAPGVTTGQRVIPLASVGCYIPSGRYPG
jgi:histidinol dehydrogenase